MASFISLSKEINRLKVYNNGTRTELVSLLWNFTGTSTFLVNYFSNFELPELGVPLIYGCSLYRGIYGSQKITQTNKGLSGR